MPKNAGNRVAHLRLILLFGLLAAAIIWKGLGLGQSLLTAASSVAILFSIFGVTWFVRRYMQPK